MTEITEEMVELAHEAFYGAESSNSRDMMRAALTAALASCPSQGGEWVMVPREPTAEMRLAGKEEHLAQEAVGGFRSDQAVSIYRAMLSAAQVKP